MKNATPNDESSALLNDKDTSASTQRLQIIALLHKFQSVNTPEFRQYGIMSPATRVLELRRSGHNIEKVLERYIDEQGKAHNRVARYYLAHNPPANVPGIEAAA